MNTLGPEARDITGLRNQAEVDRALRRMLPIANLIIDLTDEDVFAYVQRVLTSAGVLFFSQKTHCFWRSKHDLIYHRQRIPWLTPDVILCLAH